MQVKRSDTKQGQRIGKTKREREKEVKKGKRRGPKKGRGIRTTEQSGQCGLAPVSLT